MPNTSNFEWNETKETLLGKGSFGAVFKVRLFFCRVLILLQETLTNFFISRLKIIILILKFSLFSHLGQ